MEWWQWIALGALILSAETFIDSEFYLVFIGLAAVAVGLNHFAFVELPLPGQWLLFSGLAVGFCIAFRRRLYEKLRGDPPEIEDGIGGEVAIARQAIAARGRGLVELRGTTWTAHNESDTPIPARGRALVEGCEGLTLLVQPETEIGPTRA